MIRGVFLNGMTDDISKCLEIRKMTFGSLDDSENDETAIHGLLYNEDEQPVATVRLQYGMDGTFIVDQLAVLEEQRKKGYADFLMHMVFDKSRLCGAHYLRTFHVKHCSEYLKKYGFSEDEKGYVLDLQAYFNQHRCCH